MSPEGTESPVTPAPVLPSRVIDKCRSQLVTDTILTEHFLSDLLEADVINREDLLNIKSKMIINDSGARGDLLDHVQSRGLRGLQTLCAVYKKSGFPHLVALLCDKAGVLLIEIASESTE